MTNQKPINTSALAKQAQNSKEKEAYVQVEKTETYRIGMGARANPPGTSSFFLEAIINLSSEKEQVDLPRLENALICLKALKARGYTLTYEDGNCISCETTAAIQNPNEEYKAIKTLFQKTQL